MSRQVRKLGMRHPERSLKQISERMVFDHLIHLRDKEKLRPRRLPRFQPLSFHPLSSAKPLE